MALLNMLNEYRYVIMSILLGGSHLCIQMYAHTNICAHVLEHISANVM